MYIDEICFERLLNLSKINLSKEEKEIFKKDLEKIILYMDIVKNIPTDGIEALSHSLPIVNAMREDKIGQSLKRDDALKNSHNSADGCFIVPKTF